MPLQVWRVAKRGLLSGLPNEALDGSPRRLRPAEMANISGIAAHDISLWELPRNPGTAA